jgi:DNA-binding CsgD family transcriptional regulator
MDTPRDPFKSKYRVPAGTGTGTETLSGPHNGSTATGAPFQVKSLLDAAGVREASAHVTPFARTVPADIMMAMLDMVVTPTLLIDRRLNIAFANAAAKSALVSGIVLTQFQGRLIVASDEDPSFAELVSNACRGCPIKRTMVLGGTAAGAVVVWFRPIDVRLQSSAVVWGNGLVAVSFRPLRGRPSISKALLVQHFGLTVKQVEVLLKLAVGKTIDDIAQSAGVSTATVRSHLAQCFAKTGTHRQPDLISLALSLTSPVLE